jgi:hypothetical protein
VKKSIIPFAFASLSLVLGTHQAHAHEAVQTCYQGKDAEKKEVFSIEHFTIHTRTVPYSQPGLRIKLAETGQVLWGSETLNVIGGQTRLSGYISQDVKAENFNDEGAVKSAEIHLINRPPAERPYAGSFGHAEITLQGTGEIVQYFLDCEVTEIR